MHPSRANLEDIPSSVSPEDRRETPSFRYLTFVCVVVKLLVRGVVHRNTFTRDDEFRGLA